MGKKPTLYACATRRDSSQGEAVEFYIEGSGGYIIANLDLVSQEMYLSKQGITATLEPI
ncbi:hypothetical protein [Crocosphaera sp. XPORK-15E]|uniref:hypothetical protein n=1 Tax=Crocosphaera sp. XPORK-15E TaxID=3110247 RepID=UPI002B204D27|nr:hypothetical protein [Crocosphaera sp. XPORK-15E]MEA5536247.1 hypothetical protein [Crocosphaera sp. XPORK-15E]